MILVTRIRSLSIFDRAFPLFARLIVIHRFHIIYPNTIYRNAAIAATIFSKNVGYCMNGYLRTKSYKCQFCLIFKNRGLIIFYADFKFLNSRFPLNAKSDTVDTYPYPGKKQRHNLPDMHACYMFQYYLAIE